MFGSAQSANPLFIGGPRHRLGQASNTGARPSLLAAPSIDNGSPQHRLGQASIGGASPSFLAAPPTGNGNLWQRPATVSFPGARPSFLAAPSIDNGSPQHRLGQASLTGASPSFLAAPYTDNCSPQHQLGQVGIPGMVDRMTGEIQSPRVAPHRRGLRPVKSALKRGTAQQPEGRRGVSFAAPRCVITGLPHSPARRDRNQWTEATRMQRLANRRASSTSDHSDRPDWTSPCDEPMTGISSEDDAVARRYRAEEAELDRRHMLAMFNRAQNKSNCPIPTKFHRSQHPAVVESKARRLQLQLGRGKNAHPQ